MASQPRKKIARAREAPDPPAHDDLHLPDNISNKSIWINFRCSRDKATDGWAWCMKCDKWVSRKGGNTKALKTHHDHHLEEDAAKSGKPKPTQTQMDILSSFKSARKSDLLLRAEGKYLTARAIVSTNMSFRAFDNEEFRSLFEFAQRNPRFQLPRRTSATKIVDHLYSAMCRELKEILLEADSVSITSDAASMNHTQNQYVCVTAHFVSKWRLMDVVLALESAPESHTGVVISDLLDECITAWNLSNVDAVVTDNGANFVAAANALTRARVSGLTVDENLRCACHTLQLVIGDAITFKPPYGSVGAARLPPADHIETLINKVQNAVVFIRGSAQRTTYMVDRQREYAEKLKAKARKARLAYQAACTAQNEATAVQAEAAAVSAEDAASEELIDHSDHANREARKTEAELTDAAFLSEIEHKSIVSRANRLTLRNATRWSSTYLMLLRYYMMSRAVNMTLMEYGQTTFSKEEILIIGDLVNILAPFKVVTDLFQGASVTLSSVWPELAGLCAGVTAYETRQHTEDLQEVSRIRYDVIKTVATTLRESIMERFGLSTVDAKNRTAALASALDIRYKKLRFLPSATADHVFSLLRTLYEAEIGNAGAAPVAPRAALDPAPVPPRAPLILPRGLTRHSRTSAFTGEGGLNEDEFEKYRSVRAEDLLDIDPLKWWEEAEKSYPTMARIAKRILAIPCSSASSERKFSLAGAINKKDRTLLSSDRLPKLVFCKHNMGVLRSLGIDPVHMIAQMEMDDGQLSECKDIEDADADEKEDEDVDESVDDDEVMVLDR
jgi:hAT family C-terminal dimerisation region